MTPPRISVLMLDGESDFALFVARCLAEAPGVTLYVLASKALTPLRFSRHRRAYHTYQADNDEAHLDIIWQIAREFGVDVILPVDNPAVEFASRQRKNLNQIIPLTPITHPANFHMVTHKGLLADFLQKQQIPTPQTVCYAADEQTENQLAVLPFPVLLKPVAGRGGEGIRQFDTLANLLDFLKQTSPPPGSCLIQTFIHGYDIDCSVLALEGKILAYTIQRGFLWSGKSFAAPAGIEFVEHEEVLAVATQLVQATNWSGVAHMDMRYDRQVQQPKIVEVNARYWGSLIGSLMVGVNFPYLACLTALNISYPRPEYCLGRYVASGVAAKHTLKKLSQLHGPGFTFSETGWKYALTDPLAEGIKQFRKIAGLASYVI